MTVRRELQPILGALLAASLAPGCSSGAEGRGKRAKGPVLTYEDSVLPGVRHAARPGADRPRSGAEASKPSPRRCDQEALAHNAAKELSQMLAPTRVGAARALPPPRLEYLNATALGRYHAYIGLRKPRLRRSARSLRATRNIRIRFSPDHDAEEVGMLVRNSRISTYGFAGRGGCRAGWMALGPYAFVCSSATRADRRPPKLIQQPRLKPGRITPGVYGYIRRGGAAAYKSRADAAKKVMTRRLPGGFFIRFGRFTRIAGRNFWKTTKGLYVPIDRIARHVPSKFHGYVLERDHLKLPVAIVRFKGPGKRGIPVYAAPGKKRVVGRLQRYTAVSVLGTTLAKGRWGRKDRYWRIGKCQWIKARGTRLAHREPPPPGVHRGERWIDVDLDTQTLVAYEGTTPVFVTLISTGKKDHETRHGVFRVYWKIGEVDMANEAGANEEYLAEAVPWSMFFWKGQALHGAYWHDDFGRVKSHGCVNLSPQDARFLFEWTGNIPEGWRHTWHGDRFPGTVLRIRRRLGERPRLLGMARKLAPKKAVEARDADYKERIRIETAKMFGEDPEKTRKADEEKPSDEPTQKKAEPPKAAPAAPKKPRARPAPRVAPAPMKRTRRRVRRRPKRPRGTRGLVRIAPPPPPPPRRNR